MSRACCELPLCFASPGQRRAHKTVRHIRTLFLRQLLVRLKLLEQVPSLLYKLKQVIPQHALQVRVGESLIFSEGPVSVGVDLPGPQPPSIRSPYFTQWVFLRNRFLPNQGFKFFIQRPPAPVSSFPSRLHGPSKHTLYGHPPSPFQIG